MTPSRYVSVLLSVCLLPCLTAFGQKVTLSVTAKVEPNAAGEAAPKVAATTQRFRFTGSVTCSTLHPKGQLNIGNAVNVQLEYIDAGGKFRALPDGMNIRLGPVKGKKLLTAEEKTGIKAKATGIFGSGLGKEHEGKAVKFDKVIPVPLGAAGYRIVATLTHRWSGTWPAIIYKHDMQAVSFDKGNQVKIEAPTPETPPVEYPPIEEPPVGHYVGDVNTDPLPTGEPITGTVPTVVAKPKEEPFMIIQEISGGEKDFDWDADEWFEGDAKIDRGEFGKHRLKPGDKIRAGDIIVTGKGTTVHFKYTRSTGYGTNYVTVKPNSRVRIVADSLIHKIFEGTYNYSKKLGMKIRKRPAIILEAGGAVVRVMAEPFMVLLGIWEPREDGERYPPGSLWGGGVRGTTFKITCSKTTGAKTISVVEGEFVGGCYKIPKSVTSINAGEKLTINVTCGGRKTKLTPAEIQQITGLLPGPEVGKPARRNPIADAYVYAYAYRNWNKANWGAYRLMAGWHPTGGKSRAFLKFDLSGVAQKRFTRAKLRLYLNHAAGTPILKLGVHRVTSPWKEGQGTYHSGKVEKPAGPGEISWVHQPTFEKSPAASFSPGGKANMYVEVDVTELVKGWLSGTANHGLVITPVGINAKESVYGFLSREEKDKAKRPVLFIQSATEPVVTIGPDGPGTRPTRPNGPNSPGQKPVGPGGPGVKPHSPVGPGVKPHSPVGPGVLGVTDKPKLNQLQVRADIRQVRPKTAVTVPIWLEFPRDFPRTWDGRANVANLNVEIAYDPNV